MNYLLKKLYNISLILALFPWLQFGLMKGGIQPYYIVAMSVTLLLHLCIKRTLSMLEIFMILIPIIFIFLNVWNLNFHELIRESISYVAFFMSFIFFKNYLLLYGFPKRILIIVLWVWIGAGMLQYAIDPKIFDFIVLNRETSNRGVASLASEPSFFGLHFASIVSLLIFFSPNKKFFQNLSIGLFGIILSASIVAVYYFAFIVGASMLLKKLITLKLIIFFCILSILVYTFFLSGMRFGEIINHFIDYGFYDLITKDESARKRTFQSLTPFILSYDNYFLPSTFSIIDSIKNVDSGSIYLELLSNDNKIGSYLGRFVFHWGLFFVIPFFSILIYSVLISFRLFITLLLISIAFFPAISPAYPLIPFMFVYLYFYYVSKGSFTIADLPSS